MAGGLARGKFLFYELKEGNVHLPLSKLVHQQGGIMISSLEHRCSRVEAGRGGYLMKNGVNRCSTNRTERTDGTGGGGGGGSRRAKKSGRVAGRPAQLRMSFYLACEETLHGLPA